MSGEKKEEKDVETSEVNFTEVFPSSKIKALIQEDADVGIVPPASIQLMSTVSALFLRNLLQKCPKPVRHSNLSQVVEEDSQYRFLSGVLDGVTGDDTSNYLLKKRKAAAKRKRAATKKAKASKDPSSELRAAHDAMSAAGIAPASARVSRLNSTQEIVLDEEDYDEDE